MSFDPASRLRIRTFIPLLLQWELANLACASPSIIGAFCHTSTGRAVAAPPGWHGVASATPTKSCATPLATPNENMNLYIAMISVMFPIPNESTSKYTTVPIGQQRHLSAKVYYALSCAQIMRRSSGLQVTRWTKGCVEIRHHCALSDPSEWRCQYRAARLPGAGLSGSRAAECCRLPYTSHPRLVCLRLRPRGVLG